METGNRSPGGREGNDKLPATKWRTSG